MENAEKSTTMTNEQTHTLVFKDQAGEYYLLPQEVLEQGRVPAERKVEVEQLIAEAGDDVTGHWIFNFIFVDIYPPTDPRGPHRLPQPPETWYW